jgi:hypothetical protein
MNGIRARNFVFLGRINVHSRLWLGDLKIELLFAADEAEIVRLGTKDVK